MSVEIFGSVTPFTITVASLGSSTTGVGRQSTMVDNSATAYPRVKVLTKIKLGTSPGANAAIFVYAIRGDGAGLRDDNAGASDAALTVKNAELLGSLSTGSSPSTGDVLTKEFDLVSPGKEFGIAIFQNTGAALDSTAGNHTVEYYGIS